MSSRRISSWLAWVTGSGALALAGVAVVRGVDGEELADAALVMASRPVEVAVALAAFAGAFALRALLWRRVLPDLGFGQALAGIHLSLGANHVLPLRMGEPLRVLSVIRRTDLPVGPVAASTLTLRIADVAAVGALGLCLAPAASVRMFGPWAIPVLGLVTAGGAAGLWWLRAAARRSARRVRMPGPAVAAGVVAAWLLEAVLVWHSARWAGLRIGPLDAVAVTAVAVGAQVVAVAPGGFGTYEAASVAAYAALGFAPGPALAAALIAHGLKTAYALGAGAVAVFAPGPSLLGRLRVPADRSPAAPPALVPHGPVVLFLPAHDEAGSVAGVVSRAPHSVLGRPVEVLVVDDGSTDGTAQAARAAGAGVVSHPRNLGLGAAVRTGLAWATGRGAAAVAFCDADGEYAPEELADMVAPILAGSAHYVVGSRFAGRIDHMRPWRRLGNRLLTRWLSFVARQRISDGQSGYRALSAQAAGSARISHDFNYAQVLTLDLLARGYSYAEVPISYRFRTQGRSFVRLGPYLRRVVPAVYRQIQTVPDRSPTALPSQAGQRARAAAGPGGGSVLDDVAGEVPAGPAPGGPVEAPVGL